MSMDIISIEAPEVRLKLDRARTLKLNTRTFIRARQALQELRGAKEAPGLWEFAQGLDLEVLTALIWGGLEHEDKDLDVWTVASWVHPGNQERLMALVRAAVDEAMPEKRDADGEAPLAAAASAPDEAPQP